MTAEMEGGGGLKKIKKAMTDVHALEIISAGETPALMYLFCS